MKKPVVLAAIAIAATAAVAWFLVREPADQTTVPPPVSDRSGDVAMPSAGAEPSAAASTDARGPAAVDPRLAALAVSPDNGLIEFVTAPDGKVIQEIDKDPNSPSFRKPLREYSYSGDRVVVLTAYRYQGNQAQVVRTMVSYKPDGSVDQFRETTSNQGISNSTPGTPRPLDGS